MLIRDYIGEQAHAIAETMEAARGALSTWRPPVYDEILLTGSGSSLNALQIVMPVLRAATGRFVEVVNPAVLLHEFTSGGRDRAGTPLLVVLSQSGTSTTSVEIAGAGQARGWPILVVTADPESPIARAMGPSSGERSGQRPMALVSMVIGAESIGPKTKGFTASVAACLAVAERLSSRRFEGFSGKSLERRIVSAWTDASRLVESAGVPDYVIVAGSGPFFGVALEASLKLSEIAGLPAAGFETEELLHGRLHGAGPSSLSIMIAADDEERVVASRAATVMAERGVRVSVLNLTDTPTPFDWGAPGCAQPAPFDALEAIVPFQCLAVEFALATGLVPENMRYPSLSRYLAIKTQGR